jgi:hypothetical protein
MPGRINDTGYITQRNISKAVSPIPSNAPVLVKNMTINDSAKDTRNGTYT